MIIHCSEKLAAKLNGVSPIPLPETSPPGSWHGHLFTLDRRQCVMFCHDANRSGGSLGSHSSDRLLQVPSHVSGLTERGIRGNGRWVGDWAEADMTFGEKPRCTSPDFAALHPGYDSWEVELGRGGRAACVLTRLSTFLEPALVQPE